MTPEAFERALAPRIEAVRVPFDPLSRALLATLLGESAGCVEDDTLDAARDGLDVLLADLVQQCRILRLDAIPPSAVVSALERLCPLWPFCERAA